MTFKRKLHPINFPSLHIYHDTARPLGRFFLLLKKGNLKFQVDIEKFNPGKALYGYFGHKRIWIEFFYIENS